MNLAALLCGIIMAQSPADIDIDLAPRALRLTGGDLDSKRGQYFITFPPPNECLVLGPVHAKSRAYALYRAVSAGGFTLLKAQGGLTVWTIEEWDRFNHDFPGFAERSKKECEAKKGGDR